MTAGIGLYCIALAVYTGNIGFDGDDWWVLSCPYWNPFPDSIVKYAREFLRPLEGAYWIGLFSLFGFNKVVFHLCSLLLLLASCLVMGLCLNKIFPERRVFVSLSSAIAFFLPMVASLTYVMFTDNSRLSLALFWATVLAFQLWAQSSGSWRGLIPPILLYLLSFLTYESPSFLIFTVPLFVWPVHMRWGQLSSRDFGLRLGMALFVAFGAAVMIRFLVFSGGVIEHTSIVPPPSLVAAYLALLPWYLAAPFTSLSKDPWVWMMALFVTIWMSVVVYVYERSPLKPKGSDPKEPGAAILPGWYPGALGTAVVLFGILPYILAGYGGSSPTLMDTVLCKWGIKHDSTPIWFNFNEASRIYSSASFGVAILLAALATMLKTSTTKWAPRSAGIAFICFMALFHAGLSRDWKEAAAIRNDLLDSLLTHAPTVRPGTNFVFFDLESYHDRAAVIRGWAGLRELVRILYNDPTLGAWYVYPSATDWPNAGHQQAIVFPTGFISRGMDLARPAPHDSLLLFSRFGRSLVMKKRVEPTDTITSTGIEWRGGYVLKSNPARIGESVDRSTKLPGFSTKTGVTDLLAALGYVRVAHRPKKTAK